MAGSMQGGDDDMISGINVTPLVDITLVLLIIFIVTAKLIAGDAIPLDLPKAATGSEQQTIFAVELGADGRSAVDSKPIKSDGQILRLAKKAKAQHPNLRAVIKADGNVPHKRVIAAMDYLRQGGIGKIAFSVTKKAPGTPKASKL